MAANFNVFPGTLRNLFILFYSTYLQFRQHDVTYLIYVKIKPYFISLLFWQRWRGFKRFPQ